MKLSKVYSNLPDAFRPIVFSDGLNIILGKVAKTTSKLNDSHNLGKSTLCQLLDFCLLRNFDEDLFLHKAQEKFSDFVFFLEIELGDKRYLTIRRGVSNPSKLSLKHHADSNQDFSGLTEGWNHYDIPFLQAKSIIDGYLNFDVSPEVNFRNCFMYLMRSQKDYKSVLAPEKIANLGKTWKPQFANVIGLSGATLRTLYGTSKDKKNIKAEADNYKTLVSWLSKDKVFDADEELVHLREAQRERKDELKQYEISRADEVKIDELVNSIDSNIAELNQRVYQIKTQIKLLKDSEVSKFRSADYQGLFEFFEEMQICFKNPIRKSFNELVEFNRQIFDERKKYIISEIRDLDYALLAYQEELSALRKKKNALLNIVRDSDVDAKIDAIVSDIANLSNRIAELEQRQKIIQKHEESDNRLKELETKVGNLKHSLSTSLEAANQDVNSVLSKTRAYFISFISKVVDRNAELDISFNGDGQLMCGARYTDDMGVATHESDGSTYKKLLCVAFDLAVLSAHAQSRYPHFVFHDGIFEGLDDTLKWKLLERVQESVGLGMQHIITMIESDLPSDVKMDAFLGGNGEVVLTLSDEDENGLLFKRPRW